MAPGSMPPSRQSDNRSRMKLGLAAVVVAVLGTAALAYWASTDSVDDATIRTAPPEDPTVQPNREAEVPGEVERSPGETAPVVPQ